MEVNYCLSCMAKVSAEDRICPSCRKEVMLPASEINALRPGSIIRGRYLVGRILGRGGFGITYVGMDLVLETKVAIKEYFPSGVVSRDNTRSNSLHWDSHKGLITQADGCEDFLKEARKMARLADVPAIVQVKDMFLENETAYIVMEFVEGETLRDHLQKNGPMKIGDCLELLEPMIRDLEQVHRHELIHRDLSPDNIMIRPDGTVCLLDLGAAKDLSIQRGQSSMVVAKGGFSPLEQYSTGSKIGPWTDVYALCATIYYCVTGKLLPTAIDRMDDETLTFAGAVAPVSKAYQEVLAKGLAVAAEERIRSAAELLKLLERARRGKKLKKARRGRGFLGFLTAVLILALAAGAALQFIPEMLLPAQIREFLSVWREWMGTEEVSEVPLPDHILNAPSGSMDQQAKEMIMAALQEYWDTGHWQSCEKDGKPFGVSAIARYAVEDFQGYYMDAIFLRVDGIDVSKHEETTNILLIENRTGKMYYYDTMDFDNWGDLSSAKQIYAVCAMGYAQELRGVSYKLWADFGTLTHFSRSEVRTVNDLLEEKLGDPETMEEPMEGPLQVMLGGVLEYWNTGKWNQYTLPDAVFGIRAAARFTSRDYKGFPVDVLLVQVDGVDEDTHGNQADILLIEYPGGKVYDRGAIHYDNWMRFETLEDVYANCAMNYGTRCHGAPDHTWGKWGELLTLSEEEVALANQLLAERMQ